MPRLYVRTTTTIANAKCVVACFYSRGFVAHQFNMQENKVKSKTPTLLMLPLGIATLSACEASSTTSGSQIDRDLRPQSQITVLTENGDIPEEFSIVPNTNSSERKRIESGVGFAYQIGRVRNTDDFVAVAGILRENSVGGAPTVATARYTGQYNLSYADRGRFEANVSGNITLTADFTNGRLTGEAGRLSIDGRINEQNVTGSATYRGVRATLTGQIGDSRTVGAFAGNTANAVVAGGYIANRETNTNDN